MRYLPIPIFHRSPSAPVSYGFRNGQIGSSSPDQSVVPLPGIDPRTYLESTASGTSRRALGEQCLGRSNGLCGHGPNSFHNNPLGTIVASITHLSLLRSIFSRASGYQWEKGIAAYREAERFQILREESASRVFDIYV
jgi:hypothetical protein